MNEMDLDLGKEGLAICDDSSFQILRRNKCFNGYFDEHESKNVFLTIGVNEPERIIRGLVKRRRFKVTLPSNSPSREKLTIELNFYFKEINGVSSLVVSALDVSYKEEVSALLNSMQSALEIKNSQLEEALEEAETLAKAKSNFLAVMSHEIRTPMNAVLSCANLLLDSVRRADDIKLLKTIQSSGDMLITLVNDILDFSKNESDMLVVEKLPYNLRHNTNLILDLLEPKALELGVNLTLSVEQGVPNWIIGDATRIRQVLTNIIGNAIKFAKDSVQVRMAAKLLEEQLYQIEVSVVDNGLGFPEEAKGRLFKKFSQLDASTTRKFGGTGLGLAICDGLIRAMGGRIWAECSAETGTTFAFSITAEASQPAGSELDSGDVSILPRNMASEHPLKILMAEDNTVNQMVAKRLISKLGYRIDVVSNGEEALDYIKKYNYDLVLMDQHMPEMDGIEATEEIRKFGPIKPQIFALTASAFSDDRDRCLAAGMNGFLTKPINMKQVIEAFKSCPANEALRAAYQKSWQINIDAVYDFFKANPDALPELIARSRAFMPGYMENLAAAIVDESPKSIGTGVSGVKACAADFHADLVIQSAALLDLSAQKGNWLEVLQHHQELVRCVDLFLAELDSLSILQDGNEQFDTLLGSQIRL